MVCVLLIDAEKVSHQFNVVVKEVTEDMEFTAAPPFIVLSGALHNNMSRMLQVDSSKVSLAPDIELAKKMLAQIKEKKKNVVSQPKVLSLREKPDGKQKQLINSKSKGHQEKKKVKSEESHVKSGEVVEAVKEATPAKKRKNDSNLQMILALSTQELERDKMRYQYLNGVMKMV
jgi:hypothetical protein